MNAEPSISRYQMEHRPRRPGYARRYPTEMTRQTIVDDRRLASMNHIIGDGLYTNQTIAAVRTTESTLSIEPLPVPIESIAVHNMIFILFFGAFPFVVAMMGGKTVAAIVACILIGLMTCLLYTAITVWQHRDAMGKGPWLVVDRSDRLVRLPRHDILISIDTVHCLQYAVTKRPREKRSGNNSLLSELNIIIENEDGSLNRFPMLRSIAINGFDSMVSEIADFDLFPILHFRGSPFTDHIAITRWK